MIVADVPRNTPMVNKIYERLMEKNYTTLLKHIKIHPNK